MRLLTSKDEDLMTFFYEINKNEINETALKQTLIINHTVAANCYWSTFSDFVRRLTK